MLRSFGIGYLVGGWSGVLLVGLLLARHRARQAPDVELEYMLVRER
jgi:hypothetical protein